MIERFEQFAYIFLIFTVMALIATGFVPLLFGGVPTGFVLLMHVVSSSWFLITIVVYTLLHSPTSLLLDEGEKPVNPWNPAALVESILFLFMLALAVLVILSIIISMLPMIGSDEQRMLIFIHRVSALTFACVFFLHTVFHFVSKRARRMRRFFQPIP